MACGGWLRLGVGYRRDKAVAAPRDRLDQASIGPALIENPAKCGDLHVQIGVLDRRRRPYGSHELVPRYEVSCSSNQHTENVERPRADRHRHEDAALVTPEQGAGPPVETEALEQEDATLGKR